ncbi:MAG TPA: CoA-binding protein [Acidimicrobiales bacterium]|nr:CoA-binding protein [Acidimicrobiales bacterium]
MTVRGAEEETSETPGPWRPPSARERLRILEETRTIAIVGASSNPARASYFVATYLLSSSTGYTIWFVNPRETSILGRPVYPTLADLPEPPDLVDVFRRSSELPEVAREAVAAKARTFWAQLGLWNDEAAQIAYEGGLSVVMNRCVKIEHARFAGGLHLAGFDSGVINAKRPTRPGPT